MSFTDTILTSLATTGVLGILAIWLFKESMKNSLKLDLEKRLNTQRAELERIRDTFQFQVQQAMLSIQLKTEKVHEIYPELFEKIKIAEGATSALLGLRMANTWEEYSIDDLKAMMERRSVVSGKIENLAAAIVSDRPAGLKQMDDYLRMIEFGEARSKVQDSKNFLILKGLYLTDEISEDCHQILRNLIGAIIDADPEYVQRESYNRNIAEAETRMIAVKAKMRAQLSHRELGSMVASNDMTVEMYGSIVPKNIEKTTPYDF